MLKTFLAPLGEGREQNFRVRVGAKLSSERFEARAQLSVVVNLPVERERVAAVLREHRLVARAARVYDGEPSVTQTRAPPLRVRRPGRPQAPVAAPPLPAALSPRTRSAPAGAARRTPPPPPRRPLVARWPSAWRRRGAQGLKR